VRFCGAEGEPLKYCNLSGGCLGPMVMMVVVVVLSIKRLDGWRGAPCLATLAKQKTTTSVTKVKVTWSWFIKITSGGGQ